MSSAEKGGFPMTIGDRIKAFRTLKQMTQKTLAQLSGVSEISIKKYEAGDRNPKPEQVRKIAEVLQTKESLFYDINLSDLPLLTIGDAMAVLKQLIDVLGVTPSYTKSIFEDKSPSVSLTFHNDDINKSLHDYFETTQIYHNQLGKINEMLDSNQIPHEEYDALFKTTETMYELQLRRILENRELIE